MFFSKIYPIGSSPGRFYGTAKLYKVKDNGTVEGLHLRRTASNFGTTTYELATYLAQILKPLGQLQYTIKSSKSFMNIL